MSLVYVKLSPDLRDEKERKKVI